MSAQPLPLPGQLHNASAPVVPEGVLRDLVFAVVNGDAFSRCPGCETCRRYQRAAGVAFWSLNSPSQSQVLDTAEAYGVNIFEWPGMESEPF